MLLAVQTKTGRKGKIQRLYIDMQSDFILSIYRRRFRSNLKFGLEINSAGAFTYRGK